MNRQQRVIADVRHLCGNTLGDLLDKRRFIYLAVLVFVLGTATSLYARGLAGTFLDFFSESVGPQITDRAFLPLVVFILGHNAVALFLMIFLGMVFSIFPVLALFANGFIVGAALLHSPQSWWQLLPHGIFEVPAIFFAAAYGIWLGLWPFARGKAEGLRSRLKACSLAYIRLILPLLVLAGITEAALISRVV